MSCSQMLLGCGLEGWSPAQLAALAAWYEAGPAYCWQDAGCTVACGDGDPIYTWLDRSGNGYHLTQLDVIKRPTLRLVNGKWCVQFDGISDYLSLASPISFANTGYVATAYHRNEGTPVTLYGFILGKDTSGAACVEDYRDGQLYWIDNTINYIIASSGFSDLTEWRCSHFNNKTTGIQFKVNGVTESSSYVNAVLDVSHLGRRGPNYKESYQGDIIILTREATSQEVDNVDVYLNSRYGIY